MSTQKAPPSSPERLPSEREGLPSHLKDALQDLNQEDVWTGTHAFFQALLPFRSELRQMSSLTSKEDLVVKFHLPPQLAALSTKRGKMKAQEACKNCKVHSTTHIREVLRSFFQNSTDLAVTTLGGYILDEKECLGSFGLGTIFPSWELKVALKKPTKPLFGIPLSTLFDSKEKDKIENRDFFVKVIEEIKRRDDEKIFDPMAGQFSKETVLQLKKQLDYFGNLHITTSAPVNELVALLMLYLAHLPGPIFPKSVRSLISGPGVVGAWEAMNDEELLNLAGRVRNAFGDGTAFEKESARYFLDFLYLLLNKTDLDSKTLVKGFATRVFFSSAERHQLKAAEEAATASPIPIPHLALPTGGSGGSPSPHKREKKRRGGQRSAGTPFTQQEVGELENLLEFLVLYYPDVLQPDLARPLRFFGNEATTRGYVLFGTLEEERRLLELRVRERESDIDGLIAELGNWKVKSEYLHEEVKGKELSVLGLEEKAQKLEERGCELESQLRSEEEKRKKEEGVVQTQLGKIAELEREVKGMNSKLEEAEYGHKRFKEKTETTIKELKSFLQIAEQATSETSEKLSATVSTLHCSQSKNEFLQESLESRSKEIGLLNEKLNTAQNQLGKKDEMLLENAELGQEMKKVLSDLQDQLSNLRKENSLLKQQNQEGEQKFEEEIEKSQKSKEEHEANLAQLQSKWQAKEMRLLNELQATRREHQKEIEYQANEKMDLKRKTLVLEEKNGAMETKTQQAERKMSDAVLQLESHLSTLGSERKKCAEAERKNWMLQKSHAEDIRKLKKEVMILKNSEESLKAQIAIFSAPPPQTSRLTARGMGNDGLTARGGRTTYRAMKENKPERSFGASLLDSSMLLSQKLKLSQGKDEKKEKKYPSGNDLLESLAARFQTIRQLETEDVRCDNDDGFQSGFDSDSDDDMFF